MEGILPQGAWPNYVLANHDDKRILTRVGPEQARNAAMLLLTLRGTPILYYGDEIGMSDVDIPPELCLDPAGLRQPGQGRDPNRTPMQWSAEPWAGFSPPEANKTWLPIADDFQDVNVQTQQDDPDSQLSFYQELLSLRKSHAVLHAGDYRSIPQSPEGCYIFQRENKEEKVLVMINFTSRHIMIDPSIMNGGKLLLSTYSEREPGLIEFTLHPNEGVLILL